MCHVLRVVNFELDRCLLTWQYNPLMVSMCVGCRAKYAAAFVGVLLGLQWPRGNVWFCRVKGRSVYKQTLSGSVKEYPIYGRRGVKLI